MTLNISLASRNAIYLTGDFRITYRDGRVEDNYNVQKLIPVTKLNWFGLVSYSGVASTPRGREVGSWLAEQTNPADLRDSLRVVVNRLLCADEWLKAYLPDDRRLTIVVTGFQDRRPFRRVVSNFQDAHGNVRVAVPNRLQLYEAAPREPELRTLGSGRLGTEDSEELLALLRANANDRIPEALAAANARSVPLSNKTVSFQCVVGRLLPTGDGEVTFHLGDKHEGYLPDWAKRHLQELGLSSPRPKQYPDGREMPVSLTGMTTRLERKGKSRHALALLSFRNALPFEEGAASGRGSRFRVFQKVAGKDEPSRVDFGIAKIQMPGRNRSPADQHVVIGAEYIRQRDLRNAELEFRRALELDDKNSYAHADLGIVLSMTDRWPEAKSHYERAMALAPHQLLDARNYLTGVLEHEGIHAAKTETSRLLQLHPGSGLLQMALGDAFRVEGNASRALAHYYEARKKGAPASEVEPQLALMLDSSGASIDKCIEAYGVAIAAMLATSTDRGAIRFRLGVLLLLKGRREDACAQFRAAREAGIRVGKAMKPMEVGGILLVVKVAHAAVKRILYGRLT